MTNRNATGYSKDKCCHLRSNRAPLSCSFDLGTLFKKNEPKSVLPILTVVSSEVVHIAAFGEVHGVLVLALLGHLDVDEVAGVLDHELALGYSAHGYHASTLKSSIK